MSDRELLKLAAKAAGHGEVWYLEGHDTPYIGPRYTGGTPQYTTFKPLTDDGDALRLAVKLEISINPFAGKTVVTHTVDNTRRGPYEKWDCNDDDPYAATRRAIVRAAAEIGRNIK